MMDFLLIARIEVVRAFIAITIAAGGLVAVWALFLLWGWRTGQFEDAEAAKYLVFRDAIPGEEPSVPRPASAEERSQ